MTRSQHEVRCAMQSNQDAVQIATWRVVALAVVTAVGATVALNFLAHLSTVRNALNSLLQVTGGLVQATLVANLLYLVCFGAVIFGVGRLNPSDVGLRLRAIGPAILVTLGFWGAMHLGLGLLLKLSGRQLQWNTALLDMGLLWLIGQLIAQTLGNGLIEEIIYRGFFLSQLLIRAAARFRPGIALMLAVFLASVTFALVHIPNRLLFYESTMNEVVRDQMQLVVCGITLSCLYLITGNLFICVGLHALKNQPALLIELPGSRAAGFMWYVLVILLAGIWLLGRLIRQTIERRASFDQSEMRKGCHKIQDRLV